MWLGILRTAPVRCTSPVPKHQYLESRFVLCSVFGCASTGIANLVNPEDSLFGFNDSCPSFAFCWAPALEPLDPFCQLGQAAKPGELLLEFIERPCGCAPDNLPAAHNLAGRDSCLRPNHGVVFDLAVIGNPDLATDGHILADGTRPRYPCLRRNDRVLSYAYVMGDVNEVVQFCASPDFRAIERPRSIVVFAPISTSS